MSAGIYIHIPFCDGKCPYCDFYSLAPSGDITDRYTEALRAELRRAAGEYGSIEADTVYFGGGTPPLLKADNLRRALDEIRSCFRIHPEAEITIECNPCNVTVELMDDLRRAGFNRLSMGAQSGIDSELAILGRRHSAQDVSRAVEISRKSGFDNISLDLMIATSGQTEQSLLSSISFIASCRPQHISAYLLKIEPDTPYYCVRDGLRLPDEDEQGQMYLAACRELERLGYAQYEISNFSRPGYESRHNLKYWNGVEYLGFGPSAHSFFGGRRFYYPRDLDGFLTAPGIIDDGGGGDEEEYIMLRLRLTAGLVESEYTERFGHPIEQRYRDRARRLSSTGLITSDADGIRLTRQGMLLSNALISRLLD